MHNSAGMLFFLSCSALLAAAVVAQSSATPTASPAAGCLARSIRIENTPGVTQQNFYEVLAYNFSGANVALNKPTTSLSILAAGFGAAKAADGLASEASYYNSGGSGSGEFWAVDIRALTLLASVVFVNRGVQTLSCWTPPAAWTAAGINGGCDTRAINNTLRVLDEKNATLISRQLTSAAVQTFYMACAPSVTPSASQPATATQTASALGRCATTAQ